MKISDLNLKSFVKNEKIIEQKFEYAGTKGIAQLLGYHIIFFSKISNINNIVTIYFYEIENEELVSISNSILDLIDIKVRFGDNYDRIKNLYGTANSIDTIYEDIDRYNYIIRSDLFISFGLKNNIIYSMEIVNDEEMIENIIRDRNIQ